MSGWFLQRFWTVWWSCQIWSYEIYELEEIYVMYSLSLSCPSIFLKKTQGFNSDELKPSPGGSVCGCTTRGIVDCQHFVAATGTGRRVPKGPESSWSFRDGGHRWLALKRSRHDDDGAFCGRHFLGEPFLEPSGLAFAIDAVFFVAARIQTASWAEGAYSQFLDSQLLWYSSGPLCKDLGDAAATSLRVSSLKDCTSWTLNRPCFRQNILA